MMGDPLGSSRVSSQEQNRESVFEAQSRQYRATVVERAREVAVPWPGCDNWYQSQTLTVVCRRGRRALKGVDCDIPHRPGE